MVAIFADSNRARMRYIKESNSVWGTTPSSGTTRELRYTSSTMNAQKATTTSDEIRADRMVSDIVEVSATSTGDINVEFSAGSHDDFLESFAYGAWTRPMTFDSLQGVSLDWATSSTITYTGADVTGYFTVGHRIRLSGFENPINNGYFQISVIAFGSGVTTITVTTSIGIAEGGTVYSKLEDANDVIVLNSTAIRSGTSAASTFDSNGGNLFAAAITAGQLVVGQKIYVDGLGYQTSTVTIADSAMTVIANGAYITIGDGTNSVGFQYNGTQVGANIIIDQGVDEQASASNLAVAINHQRVLGNLNVSATVSSAVVTVKYLGIIAGSISKTADTNTAIALGALSTLGAASRGVYTLTSVADDVLGVTPAPSTINNTTVKVVVKGSMLRNPSTAATIIPQSFSFETGFEDVSEFFVTNGQRIGTFSYDIASNAILKGSFGLQGRATSNVSTTLLGTSPYTALGTTSTPVANATVNVGSILLDNAALSTAVQSISIKGTNNLRNQMAVGYKFPAGVGAGRIELSGTVTAYFADSSLWNKFIDHDTVAINFPLTDLNHNHYEFTFPSVVFSTDTVNPAARDQDIMETMEFMTKRDPATSCEFQIDRFSNISAMVL